MALLLARDVVGTDAYCHQHGPAIGAEARHGWCAHLLAIEHREGRALAIGPDLIDGVVVDCDDEEAIGEGRAETAVEFVARDVLRTRIRQGAEHTSRVVAPGIDALHNVLVDRAFVGNFALGEREHVAAVAAETGWRDVGADRRQQLADARQYREFAHGIGGQQTAALAVCNLSLSQTGQSSEQCAGKSHFSPFDSRGQ